MCCLRSKLDDQENKELKKLVTTLKEEIEELKREKKKLASAAQSFNFFYHVF